MAPTLNDPATLISIAEQVASDRLVDTKGGLWPTWMLFPSAGAFEVHITPWRSKFERAIALATIRDRLTTDSNIDAYCVMSEAWTSVMSREEFDRGDARPEPRNDPKRREVVMIMAVTRAGDLQGRMLDVVRDYKGMIRLLREAAGAAGAELGGELARMFDG
jgi:hypothetical protein